MRTFPRRTVLLSLWLTLPFARCLGQSAPASAQVSAAASRITQAIDENQVVQLTGNVYPLARAEFDRGPVGDAQPLHRMLLLLQRGGERESALRQLLGEQQNKSSANYHNWLTPEQFGEQFGPADADIQAITQWLSSHGFTRVQAGAGRAVIEFSGNAQQVRDAFHTEIHEYAVKGERHLANSSDPWIPAALAPVVAGIVSLNNFPAKSHMHTLGVFQKLRSSGEIKPLFTFPGCQAGNCFAMGPADFATIYNTNLLLNGSPKIDGTGQGIAIVGESNINVQDVTDFRTMFGLPQNFSSSNVILNGPDPGINSSEGESDLDVEWSGAVAPGARIDFVTSAPTETTSGIHLSAVYIVDHNLDAIMSESFGNCEQFLGTTLNQFYNSLWEQAAAQGITVILSAGDGGPAGCDDFNSAQTATHGLAVSGFASTPFNVAVGGTDFDQVGRESQFWSTMPTPTTPPVPASAKSYIPEVPWNNSCARNGLSACTSGNLLNIVAGSGGVSAIYSKPSWQTGKGVPNDNHRDLPDVSLFASNGFNGSFYIVCERDAMGGNSCSLNNLGVTFLGVGGTSASAPAFAGIMALVNQKQATAQNPIPRQGNANYVLYALAQQQTTAGLACNSSSSPASGCSFQDVTKGNNGVPCTGGSPNCSSAAPAMDGVLVATAGSTTPAYPATAGYDLATGLGSVNAANVATKWSSVNTKATTATLTLNSGSAVNVTHGQAVPFNISVSPSAATGDVSLIATPSANNSVGVGPFPLQSGAVSGSTTALPGGTQYNVTAHYEGNGTDAPSDSAPVTVTIAPEASKVLVSIPTFDPTTGKETSSNATSIPYGSPYILRVDVANSSGTVCNGNTVACPTGNVVLTDNGNSLDAGTYALNSLGFTEDQNIQVTQLAGGAHSIVANYGGDGSYVASTATDAITITPAATSMSLPSIPGNAVVGTPFTFQPAVVTQSYGKAPTGTVTLLEGTTSIGGTPVLVGADGSLFSSFAGLAALFTNVNFTTNGTHTLTAKYSGDGNYGPTTGSTTVSVLYPVNMTVTPSATSIPYGSSVSFTAIIDTNVPNLPPTGTVTFSGQSGPVTYSQVKGPSGNAALQASIPAFVPSNSVIMNVTYSGDSNYTTGSGSSSVYVIVPDFSISSNPASLTISAGQQVSSALTFTPLSNSNSTVTLTCSQPFVTGVTCTLSQSTINLTNGTPANATLTLSLPVPTGSAGVSFTKSALPGTFMQLWWPSWGALGIATLILLLLPKRKLGFAVVTALGACTAVALALGCGGGSGGGSGGSTGAPASTSTVVTLSNAKAAAGSVLTATAAVTSSHSIGGTVTFWDMEAAAPIGLPIPVTNGMAQQLFSVNLGTDQIYAKYSGDGANQPSQSAPVTVVGTGTSTVQVTAITGPLVRAATVNYTIQ